MERFNNSMPADQFIIADYRIAVYRQYNPVVSNALTRHADIGGVQHSALQRKRHQLGKASRPAKLSTAVIQTAHQGTPHPMPRQPRLYKQPFHHY